LPQEFSRKNETQKDQKKKSKLEKKKTVYKNAAPTKKGGETKIMEQRTLKKGKTD